MNKIVFLGDSLTAAFELLETIPNVVNMGIGGDKTIDLLGRINTVVLEQPDKLFLLVGINDFMVNKGRWGNLRIPFIELYDLLLKTLKMSLPETTYYIQAILPINIGNNTSIDEVTPFNLEIDALNKQIKALTLKYEMNFIDFSHLFKNEKGHLKESFTGDGIHFTKAAYETFLNFVKQYF